MRVVGIDPGQYGALAWIEGDNADVFDLPYRAATISGKKRQTVNVYALANLCRTWMRKSIVCIENSRGTPRAATSSHTIGFGSGCLVMAAAIYGEEVTRPWPADWKADMGLTDDKELSVIRACTLFPELTEKIRKGGKKHHDGRAEALCLAYWRLHHYGK